MIIQYIIQAVILLVNSNKTESYASGSRQGCDKQCSKKTKETTFRGNLSVKSDVGDSDCLVGGNQLSTLPTLLSP